MTEGAQLDRARGEQCQMSTRPRQRTRSREACLRRVRARDLIYGRRWTTRARLSSQSLKLMDRVVQPELVTPPHSCVSTLRSPKTSLMDLGPPPHKKSYTRLRRRHRSKSQVSPPSISTFAFPDPDPMALSTLSSSPHTVITLLSTPPRDAETDSEGEGGDIAARLDTMSARLRDLILEGQRALHSEAPAVAGDELRNGKLFSKTEVKSRRHRKTMSGSLGSVGRAKGSRTRSLGGLPVAFGTRGRGLDCSLSSTVG